jgi:hypothetical protein
MVIELLVPPVKDNPTLVFAAVLSKDAAVL